MPETRRVGPVGPCPRCGHHTAYALSYLIFAWGVEGGSSTFDEYVCSNCGHEWPLTDTDPPRRTT